MSSSTLIEVFRHIVFSFTRSVTEHYNKEHEFTADAFGYNPFECTGREWYYEPVEEYSDREASSVDYLASSRLNVRVINACSPKENEDTQEDQNEFTADKQQVKFLKSSKSQVESYERMKIFVKFKFSETQTRLSVRQSQANQIIPSKIEHVQFNQIFFEQVTL